MKRITETRLFDVLLYIGWIATAAAALLLVPLRLLWIAGGLK